MQGAQGQEVMELCSRQNQELFAMLTTTCSLALSRSESAGLAMTDKLSVAEALSLRESLPAAKQVRNEC